MTDTLAEHAGIPGPVRRTHGLKDHPLYDTHWGMMSRCYKPDVDHYKYYGGRGIEVCPEWHDVAAFIADIEAEIGPRPDGMTLDRIRNDDNYEPGNVKWSTLIEQRRNRHDIRLLTLDGVTQCVTAWSADLGISDKTIRSRLSRGWPAEQALTTPSGGRSMRLLTLHGETKSLAEWSRDLGLSNTTIHTRLSKGWPIERALTTPARAKRKLVTS